MAIRTTRDWLAAVEESKDIPPWVKRVLLEYGRHMDKRRAVSRSRAKIAASLGVSERLVAKAMQRAKAAGLIIVITPGVRGVTAVYQGVFATGKTMGEQGEPISQDVDTPAEVHPNDHREKVGSPHIEGNVIYLAIQKNQKLSYFLKGGTTT